MAGENKIELYLCREVKARGGEIRKVQFPNHRGAPDRLVWLPLWSQPAWVEVKDEGKTLEDHQAREHKRLRRMGLRTFMVNSKAAIDALMRIRL